MTKDEIIYHIEDLCNKAMAEGYEVGLNDGWECARKIAEREDDMRSCFHDIAPAEIFSKYTARQAMRMIKEYDAKNKEIKIGDEVIYNDEKWIVTAIANSGNTLMLLSTSGGYMARTEPNEIEKTNKNFPQIAEIFK